MATPSPKPSASPAPGQKIARVAIRVSDTSGRGSDKTAAENPLGRELVSPETQLRMARDLASAAGWWFDEEGSLRHQDIHVSGSRRHWTTRPGLPEHLEAARRGEIHAIIFWDIKRIGRNFRESLEIWDAFKAAGCTIGISTERIDDSTATGRLVRDMLMRLAEWEAERLSETLQDNLRTKALRGQPHGSIPAWVRLHRDVIPGENGVLRVQRTYHLDPAGAAAIRRLVELRQHGRADYPGPLSFHRVALLLNQEGHLRPDPQRMTTKPNYAGPSRSWTASAVRNVLGDNGRRLLRGHGIYGNRTKRKQDAPILLCNAWPAVLGEEEADALDETEKRLAANSDRRSFAIPTASRNTRLASSKWLLTGLIFCASCGGRMQSGTHGRSEGSIHGRCYRCRNAFVQPEVHGRQGEGEGIRRSGGAFEARSIERAVLRCLAAAMPLVLHNSSGTLPRKTAARGESAEEKRQAKEAERAARRTARIEEIGKLIQRAMDRADAGVISEADMTARVAALRAEREKLQAEEQAAQAGDVRRLLARSAAAAVNFEGFDPDQPLRQGEDWPHPAALAQFIRDAVQRIEVPIYFEGRTRSRNSLHLLPFIRVVLRPGLLPDVRSIVTELRIARFTGTAKVEFEES